jgi:hypothetical protein
MTGRTTDLFEYFSQECELRVYGSLVIQGCVWDGKMKYGGRRKGPWISLYKVISLWKTALVLDKGGGHLFPQVLLLQPPPPFPPFPPLTCTVYIASPVDNEPLSFQQWLSTTVTAGPL